MIELRHPNNLSRYGPKVSGASHPRNATIQMVLSHLRFLFTSIIPLLAS
ncbi:hypothetical protein PFLuk1_04794 [Pseudomonas fluorescens]|nr:hypothetical protein PFLuk1_04794 [Pseudomonas fluorescens]